MHGVLFELGFLLMVLFAGGLLADRFRQSVIPAYILVGLFAQPAIQGGEFIEGLASVGLILLLFFIGLEFSLPSFLLGWKRTLSSGSIDLLFNFPVGVVFGLAVGLGMHESLYLGAIVYISSTAIITKTMVDNRLSAHPESEVILRVLVFEDLFIAIVLALFAGVGGGNGLAWTAALAAAKVAGFFIVLTYAFRKALPVVNRVFSVDSAELFILLGLGLVVALSSSAEALGISGPVGAFLAGMLFAETSHKVRIEEKLSPFRDLCAAIFFLDFGMSIGYGGMSAVIVPVLALVAASFAAKAAGGWVIGVTERLSNRASLGVGVGLMARGEFSVILASMIPPALMGSGAQYDLQKLAAVYVLVAGIIGAVSMKEYNRLYFRYAAGRRKVAGGA